MNPSLEGIGVVREISWKDRKLGIVLELSGLEGKPIALTAEEIEISPDGSSVRIHNFSANMDFAQNALSRFVAGKTFDIPEGGARLALVNAKKLFDL